MQILWSHKHSTKGSVSLIDGELQILFWLGTAFLCQNILKIQTTWIKSQSMLISMSMILRPQHLVYNCRNLLNLAVIIWFGFDLIQSKHLYHLESKICEIYLLSSSWFDFLGFREDLRVHCTVSVFLAHWGLKKEKKKWLSFWRWHFQFHFHEWKWLYLNKISMELAPYDLVDKVSAYGVQDLGHLWTRKWLVTWWHQSHYLNQCWLLSQ